MQKTRKLFRRTAPILFAAALSVITAVQVFADSDFWN